MSTIKHGNDADLADFLATWRTGFEYAIESWRQNAGWVVVTYAVIGLTNFGEKPVPSTRLAEVLGRPVGEAEALARQWGWPGTRAGDGLITVNPERARSATRRHVQIGDRRFGVSGCGFDILQYAPLVRPSLHLEETCPVTGTPIRIVFTPHGVERVDPTSTVVAMADLRGPLKSPREHPFDSVNLSRTIPHAAASRTSCWRLDAGQCRVLTSSTGAYEQRRSDAARHFPLLRRDSCCSARPWRGGRPCAPTGSLFRGGGGRPGRWPLRGHELREVGCWMRVDVVTCSG